MWMDHNCPLGIVVSLVTCHHFSLPIGSVGVVKKLPTFPIISHKHQPQMRRQIYQTRPMGFLWIYCFGFLGRRHLFQQATCHSNWGSTIRTLLHEKINPKDWQVLSLGDVGFLLFFRVVSGHYGKPLTGLWWSTWGAHQNGSQSWLVPWSEKAFIIRGCPAGMAFPDPNVDGPLWGSSLHKPLYSGCFGGYNRPESLENTINTMGTTLLGVHPIAPSHKSMMFFLDFFHQGYAS